MKNKMTVVAALVATSMASTPASAWEFDYRDGAIVGGVAVLAAGPAALAIPAFLITGGAVTQKYGDYIPGWNKLEENDRREASPLKQCAAVKDNGITNYNNPQYGKKVVDTSMPLASELPEFKSQYSAEQRLGAVKSKIENGCSSTTDVIGGYAQGGISGNKLSMYCTNARGYTPPHMKFNYEILENGRMVQHDYFKHETGCVNVLDDSAMTAKFVADTAPGVLD